MPRTRSLAWSELKIGLLTVFALATATMLIFLLSGEGGFFWQRYSLKTVFPNIAGLKPGAPVRVAGVEVGSVTEVQFVGDRVEVIMEISRDMQPRVTSTSMASLGSISLLGEAAVDHDRLEPGHADSRVGVRAVRADRRVDRGSDRAGDPRGSRN